ncbi:class I SAM-dependent methyltransferase [Niallia sp. 03133]|uniref:class I SAM-dependent methyltransferase n=1 Tax=Niallia sp. 03133 TaxID=3458060 RepID=UPI0040445F6F
MKPTYQDALAYYGVNGAHPGGLALTKTLLEQELITAATKILDAGCGTGQTSAYIKKNYPCHVTSIDYHPTMIKRAMSRFKKEQLSISLFQGSLEKLPFADNSFDIILVESVLIFTNWKKSLSELKRVLRPNGVLLASEMTSERKLSPNEQYNMSSVYGIEKVLTEQEWINDIQEAGFTSVEVKVSHSVFSHLLNAPEIDEEGLDLNVPGNADMENKLMEHSHILYAYGNIVGYRVYRAIC